MLLEALDILVRSGSHTAAKPQPEANRDPIRVQAIGAVCNIPCLPARVTL